MHSCSVKVFSVVYFSCRSLPPKIDKLAALCTANNPDIVCLVETWLSDDILDSEVTVHNYSLIRLERNRHGGGVAIYVHNCVLYSIVLSGPAELELIIVSLCISGFKLCLGVFYRPPLPIPLFLIICVKPCSLLTRRTFLTLYY